MSKISEWLSKSPATKAGWIAAVTFIITVFIISIQTCLLNQQTKLLDRQTNISETQALLLNNQMETSSKPFVDIKIIMDNKGSDTLLVNNKGNYSISNIQVHQIYFAKFSITVGMYLYQPIHYIPKNLTRARNGCSILAIMLNYIKTRPWQRASLFRAV
jgi:hypothetical protein